MPDESAVPPAATPPEDPDAPRFWARLHAHLHRNKAMSATTKVVVTLVGALVLTAGLVMMVTPGPGLVGIVAGLAILSTEWEWADRWLTAARRRLEEARRIAAEMDPAVRRRRLLLGTAATAVVVGLLSLYIALRDWPRWSVSVWDRAQSFIGFLPELPGM
ncbi:MAG: PGPGW domain-containing protein [Nocardioidaceae bacterium]|nr:PGPGW domain-containing protein [Nocardioidaceae bacterium]